MPIPTPAKGEKQEDYHSRCMGDAVMTGEYPDAEQRSAICHNTWRRKQEQRQTCQRVLFSFDLEHDGALQYIAPEIKQGVDLKESESNDKTRTPGNYKAIAVIGDRFYKGYFLGFSELQKAYKGMDGSFHDINHYGTTYLDGGSNIEYIVGYQRNTSIDPVSKSMRTEIVINKDAPHYPAWRNYVDICSECGRVPNVSISFWGTRETIHAGDLPSSVNYHAHGYSQGDEIPSLKDLEFMALSTVLQGACNDKAGCGIGMGMNANTPDIMLKKQEPLVILIDNHDDKTNEIYLKKRVKETIGGK